MAIKWGLISTAGINGKLLEGAAESDDVEILAVASRDADRAAAYAAEHGIERSYGSYDELLADPDVQAVYNPLPNTMHSEWSIRALEAGKHVLCEKPFSSHPQEVADAFDVADRTGLVLSEAFMWRHNPQTRKLAELVAGGAIGELRLVRSAFSYALFDAGNIRLRTDVEGGALMDVGCYCVSGSRLLGGDPVAVTGRQYIGPSGTDWVFTGVMEHEHGVLATFDCATCLTPRDELEAIGSEGSVFLDDPWHANTPVIEVRRDGKVVDRIELERQNSYRLELEDMNAAIRGERGPLLGRADAMGQVRTIEGLFRSAREGRRVNL
ncbi:MAG: Gfo/Idh/MocA family oxidoreductase [Gaiellales bacterium]